MNCPRHRHTRALRAATAFAVAALVSFAPLSGSAEIDEAQPLPATEVGAANATPEAGQDPSAAAESDAASSVANLVFGNSTFAAPSAAPLRGAEHETLLGSEQATALPSAALEEPPSTSRLAATLFLGAGLVALCGWFLQRRKGNIVTGAIRHVQSYKLGARQQVSLVQVDGRRLLLGVTADGVVLLGDMTDDGPITPAVAAAVPVTLPVASAGPRAKTSAKSAQETDPLRAVATVTTEQTLRATNASRGPTGQTNSASQEDAVAEQWFSDGDEGRIQAEEINSHPHAFSASGLDESDSDGASWSDAFADAMRTATAGVSEPDAPAREHEGRHAATASVTISRAASSAPAPQPMTSYPPPRRFARSSITASTSNAPVGPNMTPPTRATAPLRANTRAGADSERSRERAGVLAGLETLRSRGATR